MVARITANVSTTQDNTDNIRRAIEELRRTDVLIGIPERKAPRTKHEGVSNAQLLYIHTHGARRLKMLKEMNPKIQRGMKYSKAFELYVTEHGSPMWHVPPRPVLEPAIDSVKKEIAEQFGQAIRAALDGKQDEMQAALKKAGMIGQNASRGWFTDGRNGWDPLHPETVRRKKSSRPLIDTGQMRRAIVYVVRRKDS